MERSENWHTEQQVYVYFQILLINWSSSRQYHVSEFTT